MSVMTRRALTKEQLNYCYKTLSSDALAALVLDAIERKRPMSVARFSDGERAVLESADTGRAVGCVQDEAWLKKYGMWEADIKKVAADLRVAAVHSTFVSPTISGLYLPSFNLYPYMKERTWYIDAFYVYYWKVADRVQEILQAAKSIHIINRDWSKLATAMKGKFGLVGTKITGFPLENWRGVPDAKASADSARAELVLVSGGPAGKRLPADIVGTHPCVALDVGCGLEVCL
jgi:hypothetical protein